MCGLHGWLISDDFYRVVIIDRLNGNLFRLQVTKAASDSCKQLWQHGYRPQEVGDQKRPCKRSIEGDHPYDSFYE
jgi:hypothetical protein